MSILALSNHAESSACLLHNGKVYAASEERFTRNKNQGGIPKFAIEWILSTSKSTLNDCKKIIYCSTSSIYPNRNQFDQLISDIKSINDKYSEEIILHRALSEAVNNSKAIEDFKNWIKIKKISDKKIIYLDHHEAHAKGVVNFYGIKDGMVFTCDGKGGFTSSAVWSYQNNKLTQKSLNASHFSLGYLYGNFTISLGYKAERHEGKLTGLAAYTKPPKDYNQINPFYVKNGKIKTKNIRGIYMPFFNRLKNTKWNLNKFNQKVKKWSPQETAATAQKILEDTILKWISQNLKKNTKNICLSGGIFGNVKLNQIIREKFNKYRIYINPAMGDLGLVLGGIKKQISSDQGMYLGPNFNKNKKFYNNLIKNKSYNNLILRNSKSAVKESIRLFKNQKPIGIFHGEMEFGPRALCHRSIIYPATDITCNDWLNQRLNRTEFMPFAPVILDIHAKKFLIGYKKDQTTSEFMTMTYLCSDEFKKLAPAVVHVDNTTRPQVLNRKKDPWFYSFLTEYIKQTGEICLINTSFNNHEEPIVCSPQDAIKSLKRSNVDAIIFEKKYLVEKR